MRSHPSVFALLAVLMSLALANCAAIGPDDFAADDSYEVPGPMGRQNQMIDDYVNSLLESNTAIRWVGLSANRFASQVPTNKIENSASSTPPSATPNNKVDGVTGTTATPTISTKSATTTTPKTPSTPSTNNTSSDSSGDDEKTWVPESVAHHGSYYDVPSQLPNVTSTWTGILAQEASKKRLEDIELKKRHHDAKSKQIAKERTQEAELKSTEQQFRVLKLQVQTKKREAYIEKLKYKNAMGNSQEKLEHIWQLQNSTGISNPSEAAQRLLTDLKTSEEEMKRSAGAHQQNLIKMRQEYHKFVTDFRAAQEKRVKLLAAIAAEKTKRKILVQDQEKQLLKLAKAQDKIRTDLDRQRKREEKRAHAHDVHLAYSEQAAKTQQRTAEEEHKQSTVAAKERALAQGLEAEAKNQAKMESEEANKLYEQEQGAKQHARHMANLWKSDQAEKTKLSEEHFKRSNEENIKGGAAVKAAQSLVLLRKQFSQATQHRVTALQKQLDPVTKRIGELENAVKNQTRSADLKADQIQAQLLANKEKVAQIQATDLRAQLTQALDEEKKAIAEALQAEQNYHTVVSNVTAEEVKRQERDVQFQSKLDMQSKTNEESLRRAEKSSKEATNRLENEETAKAKKEGTYLAKDPEVKQSAWGDYTDPTVAKYVSATIRHSKLQQLYQDALGAPFNRTAPEIHTSSVINEHVISSQNVLKHDGRMLISSKNQVKSSSPKVNIDELAEALEKIKQRKFDELVNKMGKVDTSDVTSTAASNNNGAAMSLDSINLKNFQNGANNNQAVVNKQGGGGGNIVPLKTEDLAASEGGDD